MSNELFCNSCDDYREFSIIERDEVYDVKGTNIEIKAKVSICNCCGEELFNEKVDEENFEVAYSIYRQKEGILSAMEIKEIREMYGLSQRGFSKLLRWSEITMHRYEMGSIPDKAHNNTLILLKRPSNMITILNNNLGVLSERKEATLRDRIKELLNDKSDESFKEYLLSSIGNKVDIYSGFKEMDFDKFKSLVIFFAKNSDRLFKTKLMKLLWYTDFIFFKENTISITGMQYAKLPRGPVIENRQLLLGILEKQKVINIVEDDMTNGEYILVNEGVSELNLTESELEVAQRVISYFKDYNCKKISEYSHNEKGWLENNVGQLISYKYANNLIDF